MHHLLATPMAATARLGSALANAVFPPRCVGARCTVRGAWLCPACVAAIERPATCPTCGLPAVAGTPCGACRRQPPPWTLFAAAGMYRPPLSSAVRALKYRGRRPVAAPLARLVAAAWRAAVNGASVVCPAAPPRREGGRGAPWAASAEGVGHTALLVAIPGDPSRIRRRGIDHTRVLGHALARELGLPERPGALGRARATQPQVGLSALERATNVRGCFVARGVEGRAVLLLDDVVTTGATLREGAATLRAAGATEVGALAIARALPPRRDPAPWV